MFGDIRSLKDKCFDEYWMTGELPSSHPEWHLEFAIMKANLLKAFDDCYRLLSKEYETPDFSKVVAFEGHGVLYSVDQLCRAVEYTGADELDPKAFFVSEYRF